VSESGKEKAKTVDEWRAQLSANDFEITRNAGTEPAFTGIYCDTKTPGVYNCKCCDAALFDSQTKYDSRSGWPSFYAPINEECVVPHEDSSLGFEFRNATGRGELRQM